MRAPTATTDLCTHCSSRSTPGGSDAKAGVANLQQNVLPRLREAGARAAYWLGELSDKSRRVAVIVFDSEDAARVQPEATPAVGEAPAGAREGVKVRSVK